MNELLEKAKEVSKNAYAQYSNFPVGACILSENGNIYCGCNFENASYGLSICAERNAVGAMIAAGERKIKSIAIYSPKMENCTPCGACRQVLNEFGGGKINVITESGTYKLKELLPEAFVL